MNSSEERPFAVQCFLLGYIPDSIVEGEVILRKHEPWIEKKVFATSNFIFAYAFFWVCCYILVHPIWPFSGADLIYLLFSLPLLLAFSGKALVYGWLHFLPGNLESKMQELCTLAVGDQKGRPNFIQRLLGVAIWFHPVRFSVIWWWILILGTAKVLVNELQYGISFEQQFGINGETDTDAIGSLLTLFFTTIIISIVAYIASNIIRELLTLRERYSESVKEASKVKEQMIQTTSQLNRSIEEMQLAAKDLSNSEKTLNKALNISSNLVAVVKFREELLGNQGANMNEAIKNFMLQETVHFADNVGTLSKEFIDIVKKEGDGNEIIEALTLATLSRFTENHVSQIKENASNLLTRFSNLANMALTVTEAISDERDGIGDFEFYGLMAIPPKKWLNFSEDETMGDTQWEEYLERNRNLRQNSKLKIHRYFIAHEHDYLPTEPSSFMTSEEFIRLKSNAVLKEFNSWVICSTNGKPEIANNAYLIFDKREDVPDSYNNENRYKVMPLWKVIDSYYHEEGFSGMRMFTSEECKSWLQSRDKRGGKPIDYYAVRRNQKWVFCFETSYDGPFDVADIKIWHENSGNGFEDVKERLNRIFVDVEDSTEGKDQVKLLKSKENNG